MKSRWIAAIAAASALALLVVPLMLHSARLESRTTDAPAPPHKSEGVANLDLTFKDMNGAEVRLADYKGKVILLNVWATWCGPCELEIPWLVEIQRAHPNDVVVLGVSIDDPPDKLKPYAAGKHMNYPVLVGRDREDVQDAFGPLFAIPVSVFIGRDGKIARRHSGIADKAQFEREIQGLL